jgi:hypothetical protein
MRHNAEPQWRSETGSPVFQVIVFLAAFAIVVSRRPDAVFNAQFYAEDGMVWFPQAYRFGLQSFIMPEAGYVHVFIRIVSLITLLVPFSLAPLVMNLCAIAVQILPVNIFLSTRFSNISTNTRLCASLLYLVVPNCWEIHANITNVQWHLVLLASLILLAPPENGWRRRIFDWGVLFITSLSSPLALLLVPMSCLLWWKRRKKSSGLRLAVLAPGAIVELFVALLSNTRQAAPNGPSIARLIRILGGNVFLSTITGWQTQSSFANGDSLLLIDAIAAATGSAVVLYAFFRAPFEIKVFVLFSFAALALGLARPLAGPPGLPQWEYLCDPSRGNRYVFLPMLGFLTAVLWAAAGTAPVSRVLRYGAVAFLLLLSVGIFRDWSCPPFYDYHFPKYAERFEHAPPGTRVSFLINPFPGMKMTLVKH